MNSLLRLIERRGVVALGRPPALFFSSSCSRTRNTKPEMEYVDTEKMELRNFQRQMMVKAERENLSRSTQFKKYRVQEIGIGLTCVSMAFFIYFYTIYAIKQEKFLDDFEMPDPLLPTAKN